MLTADVRFEGFTAEAWSRFLALFARESSDGPASPEHGAGGLFVVHDGSRVQKLLHTTRGRIAPPASWPVPPEELAREHRAVWVITAHRGALDECMERFGARARRTDDMTAQVLSLVGVVREMVDEGAIARWPPRLAGVPLPTHGMVGRALDAVCPDGHALALGVFDGGELWTAFIATRRGDAFDTIAGPEEVRESLGVLSGDFRRDFGHLARAVERRYAPLAFGCFGERRSFRALDLKQPGSVSRAVLLREVIVDPISPGVALALGADGARYALEGVRSLGRRIQRTALGHPLEILRALLRG